MSQELYDKYPSFYRRYKDPTNRLHVAYDSWLRGMSSRDDAPFIPIEFDLDCCPEQSVYVPKLDSREINPIISDALYYLGVDIKMSRLLGAFAYRRLLNQFKEQPTSSDDPTPLSERLVKNQQEGKNTLVVTSHFDFPELGYFKGLRLRVKKDRHNVRKSGILLNKLMTRQSFNGKKLIDHFISHSNIYFSYPISASAEKHGVANIANSLGNALFYLSLKPDLKKGGLEMDAALTGKQIIAKKNEDNEVDHYEIPEVVPSSAKLIEGFDKIIGATLIMSPITKRWEMEIGELLDIKELLETDSSSEIVDSIYGNIAKSVEKFTGKEVVYSKMVPEIGKLAIEQSDQNGQWGNSFFVEKIVKQKV